MIGLMVLDLFGEQFHSLKDKRQILNSLKERLPNRFNVAVAETDFQETWQKAQISLVSVANRRQILEKLLSQVERFVEDHYALEILAIRIDFF